MLALVPDDVTDAVPAAAGAGLLEEADRLYARPLEQFTAARDARAKELKGHDAALSRAVKGLRKPSVAAWAVNHLVRREGGQVARLVEVGAALREAQEGMDAEELRALTRQRRQLTAAVAGRARALAAQQGQRLTPAVLDQVEATLTAAMVDPGAARAVRSGQLVGPLATTGVDEVDAAAAVAIPEALGFTAAPAPVEPTHDEPPPRPGLRVVPDPHAEDKARRAAQQQVDRAAEALAEVEEEADEADAAVGRLQARAMQLQAEIDELRRRVAELESRAEEVDDELEEAEEEAEAARAAMEEARAAHDAARKAREALG